MEKLYDFDISLLAFENEVYVRMQRCFDSIQTFSACSAMPSDFLSSSDLES